MVIFPEPFVKIRQIIESAGKGRLSGGGSLCQKQRGLLQAVLV